MDSPVSLTIEELPDAAAIERARLEVQERLARGGSQLAQADWGEVRGEVSGALQKALGRLDLLECLGRAWGSAREVRQLASESLATPGKPGALPLADHILSAEVHPIVTLKWGELTLDELRFTLMLDAKVDAVVLIVRDGRLTALEAVKLSLGVSLFYGEQQLCGPFKKPISLSKPYALPSGGIIIAEDRDSAGTASETTHQP